MGTCHAEVSLAVTSWLQKQLHLQSLCKGRAAWFVFSARPRCQADDTASALHTSLLNEASYSEHLEPAGGLPWDAPSCEIHPDSLSDQGGAEAESVAVQTVADDELAAAAAALVEAGRLEQTLTTIHFEGTRIWAKR